MPLLLPRQATRLERGLALARPTLGVGRSLERAICGLQLRARALGRVGQLIHDAASGLFRGVQSCELALQRVEGLNGCRVALLGNARLVLALGEAEPHVRNRLLVMPTRLSGGEQRRAVLRIAWLELGDGLRGRDPLVIRPLPPWPPLS